MKLARLSVLKTIRLICLAAACIALNSHAQDQTEISQLTQSGKFAEALAKVDTQLASKPTDPKLRFLKGVLQRNLGKSADAIATFTKLTEDFPELPEPYNNLAVLFASQGQYDKARDALEMAIRTNPSYATAHENMGDVYTRLASQAYAKALQLDKGNPVVQPKLELIREIFEPNMTNPRPVVAVAKPATPTATGVAATTASAITAVTKPAVAAASAAVPVPPAKQQPDAVQEAEAAVLSWAKAWSSKDVTSYLAAYSPDFTPPGEQTRSAWEKNRRTRITGKSRITITISDLKVKVTGNKAVATFRQSYRGDALAVSSHKTLVLHSSGNQWLITKESSGK